MTNNTPIPASAHIANQSTLMAMIEPRREVNIWEGRLDEIISLPTHFLHFEETDDAVVESILPLI